MNEAGDPRNEMEPEGSGPGSVRRFLLGMNNDVFIAALVLFAILIVVENIRLGTVSFFFNLDILVPVVLITGVIAIFAGKNEGGSGGSPG